MKDIFIDCINNPNHPRKYPTWKYYAMVFLMLIALIIVFLIAVLDHRINTLYILIPCLMMVVFFFVFIMIVLLHKKYWKQLHEHFNQKPFLTEKQISYFLNSIIFFYYDHKYKKYSFLKDEIKTYYAELQNNQAISNN
ncbi:hypothetical protein OF377_00070 [Ureaplasma sp. ES3154-GEN]|uniref:hypothetical protein n=1 Tax=Ureaplasma sp. ES3154-GEN TaxID=2984844 RepID=UPI0021E8DF69|nr:hypothetical protein [Ureaplasma sp. ES3154-GEN]MCV3743283.1 hypothetical protein [Ureaplasma sp. ES3154-GEN]